MARIYVFGFLALAHVCAAFLTNESSTLIHVNVLYRHGDRVPLSFYPTDPWANYSWQGETGTLTTQGMMRHYKMGQYLRRRYASLLNAEYNREDIYVRSTDSDRTLESAYCNLAGLYPPYSGQLWNADIPWQPIAVHTIPLETDGMLYREAYCPRADEEVERLTNSEELKTTLSENSELLQYLSIHSGQIVNTFQSVDYLKGTLITEAAQNLQLPAWTEGGVLEKMTDLLLKANIVYHSSQLLRTLRGGLLIGNILEHMYNATSGGTSYKMRVMSAHDVSLRMLLSVLGIVLRYDPPFASTVMIELYESNYNYFVKVLKSQQMYFQNRTDEILAGVSDEEVEPYLLQIPGCSAECPLDELKSLMEPYIPDDWERECGITATNTQSPHSKGTTTALIALSSAFLIYVAGTIAYCQNKQRKSNEERVLLEQSTSSYGSEVKPGLPDLGKLKKNIWFSPLDRSGSGYS